MQSLFLLSGQMEISPEVEVNVKEMRIFTETIPVND